MNYLQLLPAAPFNIYFDEGEGGEGEGDAGEGDAGGSDKATFTQEQVNTMLANNKKNLQTDLAKKTKALTDAQANVNLSQEEKDALAIRVNDLESLMMTDKELAARDKKKAAGEYKVALEKSETAAKKWKGLHDTMLISTAITNASMIEGQKAVNPSQLVSLFGGDASVVEADGVFSVQVSVATVGEDGVAKTLTLAPEAAIKEYASRNEYMNLFDDPSKDGLNRRKTSGKKPGALPTNMADYKANREDYVQ